MWYIKLFIHVSCITLLLVFTLGVPKLNSGRKDTMKLTMCIRGGTIHFYTPKTSVLSTFLWLCAHEYSQVQIKYSLDYHEQSCWDISKAFLLVLHVSKLLHLLVRGL